VFDVDKDEPILTAALRQGINLPYGCRSGNCGTCKSHIIEGDIHYDIENLSLLEEEKQKGIALLCQAKPDSDLVIEAQVIPENEEIIIKKLPCRVMEKKMLCHDVVSLRLKLPTIEKFAYLAGQYIDILLPDGRHRSFSIANAPHTSDSLELHIRVVEGGEFTNHILNDIEEKTILRIEGPHGQFYLHEESDRDIIFMAGGTGFAPIKGIIEYAITNNIERQMYLYWGVRSEEDLYMHKLAEMWSKDFAHIHYVPVLSDPKSDETSRFRTGYVHEAIIKDFPDGLARFDLYASGPPAMIEAGRVVFELHQLPPEQYYSDAFEFQENK
jgi:CDP-4-dehydro-6-deoxyglucose reductase